jgi:hypothetical protein
MAKTKRNKLEIVPSNSLSQEDKRVFCRFVLNDVPLRFKDLKMGEKNTAVCKDLSGGGAGVECAQEIKPRTPLEMWFDLPDGFEPLHCLGKVIWSRLSGTTWQAGVAFERPKLISLARILKLQVPENA